MPSRRVLVAALRQGELVGLDAHQDGHRVGAPRDALGEHRHHAVEVQVVQPDRLAVRVDQPRPRRPRRLEQRPAGTRPQRPDREDRGQPQRTERAEQQADQDRPPADLLLALRGTSSRPRAARPRTTRARRAARSRSRAGTGTCPTGSARTRRRTGPRTAGRPRAAPGPPSAYRIRSPTPAAIDSTSSSTINRETRRSSGRGGGVGRLGRRAAHDRSPMNRMTSITAPRPMTRPTNPSTTGPPRFSARPPAIVGSPQVQDVAGQRVQLLVRDRALVEHRHRPRADPDGLPDLRRRGVVQARARPRARPRRRCRSRRGTARSSARRCAGPRTGCPAAGCTFGIGVPSPGERATRYAVMAAICAGRSVGSLRTACAPGCASGMRPVDIMKSYVGRTQADDVRALRGPRRVGAVAARAVLLVQELSLRPPGRTRRPRARRAASPAPAEPPPSTARSGRAA